jgi:hypothetical protein
MALQMKANCEKCGRALAPLDEAFICIYECTFCGDCVREMEHVCPNCGGELVRRPRAGKVRAGN